MSDQVHAVSDHSHPELLADYALGVLDADGVRAVASHVRGCETCAAALQELQDTVSALALTAAPQEPRPALRERVLSAAVAPAGAGARRPPSRTRRETGWMLAAAASLLVAAFSGVTWLSSNAEGERLRADVARLEQTLADQRSALAEREQLLGRVLSPQVEIATLTSTGREPLIRLYWSRAEQTLVLAARGLPPAPSGTTYQLWGIGADGRPVGLGTFNTAATGDAVQQFDVAGSPAFDISAVTREPEGGSPAPTSEPFLVGRWPTRSE